MKKFLLFTSLITISSFLFAQTASVQFINNSADENADTVDIYLNNVKIVNDFIFRTSTPFLNISSGTSINLKITKATATNSSNPLFSKTLSLTTGDTAVAILEGLLSLGYAPPRSSVPFDIHVYGGVKTTATSGSMDVLFHQGVTDIKTSNLLEIPSKSKIFSNMEFGDIANYKSLVSKDYIFQLREARSQKIIGEFDARFKSNGYSGKAFTLLTSGFHRTNVNKFGRSLGLFVSLPEGGALIRMSNLPSSVARVQFIHNSADASVSKVDVWINDSLLYDDFTYLNCQAFEDFPADSNFVISITNSNSTDTSNSIIKRNLRLSGAQTHIFILEGINSNSGYNPGKNERPFVLHHFNKAAETSIYEGNTDLAFHNGSTDLDIVDFYNSVIPSFLIIDNISYQETSGYIPFVTQDFDVQVRRKRETRIVAQFRMPLLTLGFQDSAGLVMTSGFLDPSQNSNGNDLGLYYAPPEGGPMLEFQKVVVSSTLVQFLHNSPDLSLDTVDIYINKRLRVNNLAYRTSTDFLSIYADSNQTIVIADRNSENASNPLFSMNVNYDANTSRYLIIEGLNDNGYNPSAVTYPLNIQAISGARILPNDPGNTDVLFYNGSTDAGIIDINENSTPIQGLANDLDFGDYSNFHEMAVADYDFEVTDGTGKFKALYDANFQSLNFHDLAIVVLASGFEDPTQNKNASEFGLYVSLPHGGKFIKLPILIGVGMDDNNKEISMAVFPNPSNGQIQLSSNFSKNTILKLDVYDASGRLLHHEILNAESGDFSKEINLDHLSNGMYIMQLSDEAGILGRNKFQIVN